MKRTLHRLIVIALVVFSVQTLYAALSDRFTVFYELEEDTGDSRLTEVGSLHLTPQAGPGRAAGKVGFAVDLEAGSSQFLNNTSANDLAFGDQDFFCVAWVRGETLTGDMNIITKGSGSHGEYSLQRNPTDGGRFKWDVWGASGFGSPGTATDTTVLSNGTWYHIYVWHDSVNNQVGIRVNLGTPSVNAHSAGVVLEKGPFELGAYSAFGNYWDGLIDQAGCGTGLLSSQEQIDLYNSGNGLSWEGMGGGGGEPPPPSLPRLLLLGVGGES